MTASEYDITSHGDSGHEAGHLSDFQLALLLVSVGLFLGSATRFIQQNVSKIKIPYTVVLFVIGIILGLMEDHLGKLGKAVHQVRSVDPHLLLGAFIPALIFEAAFGVNYHTVSRIFFQALLLAGPGVLINTSLTAVFVKYVLPYGWTWAQCTLFGSIVSATDPVAVVSLLRELGASKRLATLIEGESLLNDGTAFVLYMIALEFVKGENPGTGGVITQFLQLAIVGSLIGVGFGLVIAFWLKLVFNDSQVEITITIFTCYLCFFVTETQCHSSGVLACVFLGLVLSKYKLSISPQVEHSLHHVWEILGFVATTLIFVFGGIIICDGVIDGQTVDLEDTGYLLLIYVYIHITRIISMSILWYPLKKTGYGITRKDAVILCIGGLRGVIGLALALLTQLESLQMSHEAEAKFKYQIMFHTSGIVFLTLLINAVAMKYVVQYLGLDKPSKEAEIILRDAMEHLRQATKERIEHLKGDYNYSGADWSKVFMSLPNYAKVLNIGDESDIAGGAASGPRSAAHSGKARQRTERTQNESEWDAFKSVSTLRRSITAKLTQFQLPSRTEVTWLQCQVWCSSCCRSISRCFCCRICRKKRESVTSSRVSPEHPGRMTRKLSDVRKQLAELVGGADDDDDDKIISTNDILRESNVQALKQHHQMRSAQNMRFGKRDVSFNRVFRQSLKSMQLLPFDEEQSEDLKEADGNIDLDAAIHHDLKYGDDGMSINLDGDRSISDRWSKLSDSNIFGDRNGDHLEPESKRQSTDGRPEGRGLMVDSDQVRDNWEIAMSPSEQKISDSVVAVEMQALKGKAKGHDQHGQEDFFDLDLGSTFGRQASLLPGLHTMMTAQPSSAGDSVASLGQMSERSMQEEVRQHEEKRKQFAHRILNVMKMCYHVEYEEGSISQNAASAMHNAVEIALDYNDLKLQHEYLLGFFKISKFSKFFQTQCANGKFGNVANRLLLNKLSVAVEVGTVFISTVKKVADILSEVEAIANSPLCQDLVEQLENQSNVIREEWLGIQQSYPSLYRAIQTRHACQHMIHSEGHNIEELRHHGLLDDTEHERLIKELHKSQHKLAFTMFSNISLSSEDKKTTLLHLPFCNKVAPRQYHLKMAYLLDHAVLSFKNREERLFEAGDKAKGIYVLVRGSAVITMDGEVKDTKTCGSILAWEYLVKAPYVCSCEAQTSVEYYFIPDAVVQFVIEGEHEAMVSLWKTAATNVILAYFRESFSDYTRVNVSSMVQMAIFHTAPNDKEEVRNVRKNTLLIKGAAQNADTDVSNKLKKMEISQMLEAPVLLLPSKGDTKYTLEPGSIILTFEFEHLIQRNRFNPLQRRGSLVPGAQPQIVTVMGGTANSQRRRKRTLSVNSSDDYFERDGKRNSSLPGLRSMLSKGLLTRNVRHTHSDEQLRSVRAHSVARTVTKPRSGSHQMKNTVIAKNSQDSVLDAVDESIEESLHPSKEMESRKSKSNDGTPGTPSSGATQELPVARSPKTKAMGDGLMNTNSL